MHIHILSLSHWLRPEDIPHTADMMNSFIQVTEALKHEVGPMGEKWDIEMDGDHRDTEYYLGFHGKNIPKILQLLLDIGAANRYDIEPYDDTLDAFLCYPFKREWGENMYLGDYSPETDQFLQDNYDEVRSWKDAKMLELYEVPDEVRTKDKLH